MKRLKPLLRRIPVLASTYRQASFFAHIAYEGWWVNPQERVDQLWLKQMWDFESAVEQERLGCVLAAVTRQLGVDSWGDVLEVGCSYGVFTSQLARRCRFVTACDISPAACARAAEHCAEFPHVRIEQLNVVKGRISGHYDLVFVMDVLEMIHGRRRLREVATKLIHALRSDGLLVFSGCRLPDVLQRSWVANWLLEGGDSLVTFLGGFGLRLVYQEPYPCAGHGISGYPDHVIALFEKNNETQI